jgi:hypothetical protein
MEDYDYENNLTENRNGRFCLFEREKRWGFVFVLYGVLLVTYCIGEARGNEGKL